VEKWLKDLLEKETDIATSIRDERLSRQPIIPKPIENLAPKTTSSWDNLGLQERTKLVIEFASHLKANGRSSPNMDDCVKLAEWGYNPRSSDIQMYLNNLVGVEDLQPKTSPPKAVSLAGTLTEANLQAAEQNRIDEYKRQQAINDFNRVPDKIEPAYRQY
jgi:hypothetical protein